MDCGFCRYETTKYLWDSIFGLDINMGVAGSKRVESF